MKLVRPVLYLLVAATMLQACIASFGRLHGERRDVTLSWAKYSRPLDGLAIYDGFKKGLRALHQHLALRSVQRLRPHPEQALGDRLSGRVGHPGNP